MATNQAIIPVIPFQDLPEYPSISVKPRPTRATVREIDARLADGELLFFYSRANYRVDLTTYPQGIDGLLRDVRLNSLSMPDVQNLNPLPPLSPLDLQNRHLCYVIFRLVNTLNWQFAYNHPPFTIEADGPGRNHHYEARRVDSNGVPDRILNKLPEKDGSMVAYFISDGATASTVDPYHHALNIHVDLLFGGAQKARLPLMIDPDVRYPGGSGIDPYP